MWAVDSPVAQFAMGFELEPAGFVVACTGCLLAVVDRDFAVVVVVDLVDPVAVDIAAVAVVEAVAVGTGIGTAGSAGIAVAALDTEVVAVAAVVDSGPGQRGSNSLSS